MRGANKTLYLCYNKLFFLVGLGFLFASCHHQQNSFEVNGFEPLTNWTYRENGIKTLYLDYEGAIMNGFVIPSANQVKGGEFVFRFSVKNNGSEPQKLCYKIYYQNESYKFPECARNNDIDTLSAENFYGSWENVSKTFATTDLIPADNHFHEITDSFRIVGNPRDEQRYYGLPADYQISEKDITNAMERIKGDKEWYESIVKKAKQNQVPLNTQLRRDAIYVLKQNEKGPVVNNRWERNPRVGKYSFLLAVTTEKNITDKKIPDYIANVGDKNGGSFVNPYYYYLFDKSKTTTDQQVVVATDTLKVKARPDLGKGIYITPDILEGNGTDSTKMKSNCNSSKKLFWNAPFGQYLTLLNSKPLNNVPVVADVEGDKYTMQDYKNSKYSVEQLIKEPVKNTHCPCENVNSDSVTHKITLVNPASPPGKWIKQDVGIISRNGFTYGKFDMKVKLPKLLNKSKVWNGLTTSVWLIYQQGAWNNRRPTPNGYISRNIEKADASSPRQKNVDYTEIDFEVLKATHYWPATSYKRGQPVPRETPADSDKIMVTYTNWDLACKDVKRYTVGADSIAYDGKYFGLHRWDDYYRALTGKDAESDDEVFGGDHYYFEIEWKPKEIIWRIGPEKDKLHVIGYMNDSVTNIPNNQMVLVITKQFHYSIWWPGLPMPQETIPFPAKDIGGELDEFTIE